MRTIIFCGGAPLQLTVDGQPVPKPMVKLGTHPVLWHVMRAHAAWGMDDFVLCLGTGADVIKRYFLEYQEALSNDFVLTGGGSQEIRLLGADVQNWRITFADTGKQAPVLDRLRTARPFVEDEHLFSAAYGDVLTDAPLDQFLSDFGTRDEVAAVLAVRARGGTRLLDVAPTGIVKDVRALQRDDRWMAGGYFFFRREIFDELPDSSMLDGLLPRLAAKGQLRAYLHDGFWSGMDSLRDVQELHGLVESGTAPWDPRNRLGLESA